jgi:hypothetical protein
MTGLAIIAFGLIAWSGVYIYFNSYVPYVPLVSPPIGDFIESPKINTPEHQKRIIFVLNKYHIKWKIKNGKVMIQRKQKIGDYNRNFLWNLTNKAEALDL